MNNNEYVVVGATYLLPVRVVLISLVPSFFVNCTDEYLLSFVPSVLTGIVKSVVRFVLDPVVYDFGIL